MLRILKAFPYAFASNFPADMEAKVTAQMDKLDGDLDASKLSKWSAPIFRLLPTITELCTAGKSEADVFRDWESAPDQLLEPKLMVSYLKQFYK